MEDARARFKRAIHEATAKRKYTGEFSADDVFNDVLADHPELVWELTEETIRNTRGHLLPGSDRIM